MSGSCAVSRREDFTGRAVVADEKLHRDLWKLRAALILLGTERGAKVGAARACASELKARGLKVSLRSIYRWRNRYLLDGFAGIARKGRSDRGYPRQFDEDVLVGIVDAAVKVRYSGDISRAFRRLNPPISYESFRVWVRRIQTAIRTGGAQERGKSHGLVL